MIVKPLESATKLQRSEGILWPSLAVTALGVIVLAAIRWSLDHPFGIHWDEAAYFDDVGIDVQRARGLMLVKLVGRILLRSHGHPPAFRILALPFLTLFGFHTTLARMVSLGCFVSAAGFVYLATRRVAGQAAAAFAALVFALSPEVVSGSIFFSTDAPLYLATAATLYFIIAYWNNGARPGAWIGLGLAIGLGFLAKASFLIIALPVLAFWFFLSKLKPGTIEGPAARWKAGVLAFLVAGPWWVLNAKDAIAYGQYARGFSPNSLGQPSLSTWMHWLQTVALSLLGPALATLLGLLLITLILQAIAKHGTSLTFLQKEVLGACACAGIPIVLAQLSGTNHLLRHISPVLIPLAIAAGIIADNTGWVASRLAMGVAGVLLCGQLVMIVSPVVHPNATAIDAGLVNGSLPWRVMHRFDEWDWKALQEISSKCGVPSPKISFLGGGLEFNPPQIEYPWVVRGLTAKNASASFPDVRWLWRSDEGGAIDWNKTMELADQSDIVLTAPKYSGLTARGADADDQHNAEFAERLSHDTRFQAPIALSMGRFQPVEVLAYVKKSLVCQSGPTVALARKAQL